MENNACLLDILEKNDLDGTDEYKFGNQIGESFESTIFKARYLPNGEKRAIRIINKRRIFSIDCYSEINSEISTLLNADHPNIIKIYSYCQTPDHYYIAMERPLGPTLLSKILESGMPSESCAANYMSQIFSILSHLKTLQIAHRNIKHKNFVFTSENSEDLKLLSFKRSIFLQNGKKTTGRVGTPFYTAPEVLKGTYDYSCDTWSAGVIMYMLLGGSPPFNAKLTRGVFRLISQGEYNFDGPIWDKVSDSAKDLIAKLLTVDVENRITPDQALRHEWFQSVDLKKKKPSSEESEMFLNSLRQFEAKEKSKKMIYQYIGAHFTTSAERDSLLALFQAFDTDHSGFISIEELKNGFLKVFGNRIKNIKLLEKLLENVDLNSSGDISYNEFIVTVIEKQKILDRKRLEKVFKSITLTIMALLMQRNLEVFWAGSILIM